MDVINNLKNLLSCTTEDVEDDSSLVTKVSKLFKNSRIDISNPLSRIKDIKSEALDYFNSQKVDSKEVITEDTKDMVYTALYNRVEEKLNKGKPIEECKLLFKTILELDNFDEDLYSSEDILYIQTLVSIINNIKTEAKLVDSYDEGLVNSIAESDFLLEIIEILDLYYGLSIMNYACTKSYVLCGYKYKRSKIDIDEDRIKPYYTINIGDKEFYLLNEIKSLINNDSEYIKKREYLTSKIKHHFNKYIILNNVQMKTLFIISNIFSYLDNSILNNYITDNNEITKSVTSIDEYLDDKDSNINEDCLVIDDVVKEVNDSECNTLVESNKDDDTVNTESIDCDNGPSFISSDVIDKIKNNSIESILGFDDGVPIKEDTETGGIPKVEEGYNISIIEEKIKSDYYSFEVNNVSDDSKLNELKEELLFILNSDMELRYKMYARKLLDKLGLM